MLSVVAVDGYRSLRRLRLPLRRLTVVTGANGSGKSSLYRALRLLADSAGSGVVGALAREGGLPSTLWAGPEAGSEASSKRGHPVQGTLRSEPLAVRLGFSGDTFGYAIDLGLPSPQLGTMFCLDPEIKAECVWAGPLLRPASVLVERHGAAVSVRDETGEWRHLAHWLHPSDSMLARFADPEQAPELLAVREQVRSWRFYDHFRTDATAPARAAHIGTRTPVLSHDGADLAAALQTIVEIGDASRLHEVVDVAFPGSRVVITDNQGRFELALQQPGLLRPLGGAELSDGTLRYLLLTAALLTPRAPELMVLNEPETSLHPDLLPALAQLMIAASATTQLVTVTHSRALLEGLLSPSPSSPDVQQIELAKRHGETQIVGQGKMDEPAWQWPKR